MSFDVAKDRRGSRKSPAPLSHGKDQSPFSSPFEASDVPGEQLWLSVLIPIYNVRPFLEECVRSVLDQLSDQSGIELILVDDKSTDGSADLCQRMISEHGSNVRLLYHAENIGVSAARNSLLEAARGEYVWYLDSDDKLLPGAIEALGAILENDRPDVVICDYIRGEDERYATFDGPAFCLDQCKETLIAGTFANRRLHIWSRVWKRSLFGSEIRFPVGACFEDAATVPWLLLKAESYHYAAEPWIYYRSRPDSIMARLAVKRAAFDVRRNDDLANALTGFKHDLAKALPAAAPGTLAVVARFQSREFVKISKRLLRGLWRDRSWSDVRRETARYRLMMETSSPIPFAVVARQYLARGKVVRAIALSIALAVAGNRVRFS